MDIAKIDKNFAVNKVVVDGEIKYYKIPSSPFDLYGVYYEERCDSFVRMPSEIAEKVNEGVKVLNCNPAGGRIRFKTDSNFFSLSVKCDGLSIYSNMTSIASNGFVLVDESKENRIDNTYEHRLVAHFCPLIQQLKDSSNGYTSSCKLNGGVMRSYSLYLPTYTSIKEIVIGVEKDAKVEHGESYKDIKPILYYGSSITQGGCASRSDLIYQNIIEKWNNIDYINLGFSGSCHAEEEMVKYLSTIECSLFVYDYDHNAPEKDELIERHFSFYEAFRKAQPNTPIIIVSSPDYWDYPSWWQERLDVIYNSYKRAKKGGDKNVYFISGKELFGKKDAHCCTVDRCHPNDIGFYRMAKRIYKEMKKVSREFK